MKYDKWNIRKSFEFHCHSDIEIYMHSACVRVCVYMHIYLCTYTFLILLLADLIY
jgi:hypothetical protein